MKKPEKKISLDLQTVFSPYSLAAALAALHRGHVSEIFVPNTFRFIELYGTTFNFPPMTLDLKEDADDVFLGMSRGLGFAQGCVASNDPFVGLLMLRRALKEGLVTEFNTDKLTFDVARQFAGGQRSWDWYAKPTPNGVLHIGPDQGGFSLEGLIGQGLLNSVQPVFGDHDFLVYFANQAVGLKLGTLVDQVPRDPTLEKLRNFPDIVSAELLYKYAADPEFGRFVKFLASDRHPPHEKGKHGPELLVELCALAVDHGTHTVVAGGSHLLYKFWKSFMKTDKTKN